jgi:hypothetical protein
MKRIWMALLCVALALLQVSSVAGEDGSSELHPLMKPDKETLREWIEEYENAPDAVTDGESGDGPLRAQSLLKGGSLNLLEYMQYLPHERDQRSCGNCWVWAGTGIVEIALGVNSGTRNRLSTQLLNSCKSDTGACCGGTLNQFRNWYSMYGSFIPWSNVNGAFVDGTISPSQCAASNLSCGSILTIPNYPIVSISPVQKVPTRGLGQAAAIESIKNVLNQKKAIYFAMFLPNGRDWNSFRNFWYRQPESDLWSPDLFCGQNWSYDTGSGHALLIGGYNDEDPDPSKHYWVVLNSWGTPSGRPNGLFRMPMRMNYDCLTHDDQKALSWPLYQFTTFDVTLQAEELSLFPEQGTLGTSFTISGKEFGSGRPLAHIIHKFT